MRWIVLDGGECDGQTIEAETFGPVIYVQPPPAPIEIGPVGGPPVDTMVAPLRYVRKRPPSTRFVVTEDVRIPRGTLYGAVTIPHVSAEVYVPA